MRAATNATGGRAEGMLAWSLGLAMALHDFFRRPGIVGVSVCIGSILFGRLHALVPGKMQMTVPLCCTLTHRGIAPTRGTADARRRNHVSSESWPEYQKYAVTASSLVVQFSVSK